MGCCLVWWWFGWWFPFVLMLSSCCAVWCFWVLGGFGGFVRLIVICLLRVLLVDWFLVGFVWCCVVWLRV